MIAASSYAGSSAGWTDPGAFCSHFDICPYTRGWLSRLKWFSPPRWWTLSTSKAILRPLRDWPAELG